MRRHHAWLSLVLLPLLSVGCSVLAEDPKRNDAEPCQAGTDCKSGICTSDGLCGASSCDCPGHDCAAKGSRSNDCDARQVCVVSTSIVEDVGMFFSDDSDNDGYCRFPCSAACPEHYSCAAGADFCVLEQGWADPVPTISWRGAADGSVSGADQTATVAIERGQAVSLTGSGTSPIGAPLSFAWQLVDASGHTEQASQATLEVTLDGDFRRAELTVSDDRHHASVVYAVFEDCAVTAACR